MKTHKTHLENGLLMGIGLLSMTREKAQGLVSDLSKRGDLEKDQVEKWIDELTERGDEERQVVRKMIREEIKSAMNDLDIVTKKDVRQLSVKDNAQDME